MGPRIFFLTWASYAPINLPSFRFMKRKLRGGGSEFLSEFRKKFRGLKRGETVGQNRGTTSARLFSRSTHFVESRTKGRFVEYARRIGGGVLISARDGPPPSSCSLYCLGVRPAGRARSTEARNRRRKWWMKRVAVGARPDRQKKCAMNDRGAC